MTVDVETTGNTTTQAEIDSTISGSSYQLVKDDAGALILGAGPTVLSGGVTVGSLIDEGTGTLSLNGSTTITNTDNGGAGSNIGLTVDGQREHHGQRPAGPAVGRRIVQLRKHRA